MLLVFIGILCHIDCGFRPEKDVNLLHIHIIRNFDKGLRGWFNALNDRAGARVVILRMQEMHNQNLWFGPARNPLLRWVERRSPGWTLRIKTVKNDNKNLVFFAIPEGARNEFAGGVTGMINEVFVHPNEMALAQANKIETDLEDTRGNIGGTCCIWNWNSRNSRVPRVGMKVVTGELYRRNRDGMLVANKWVVLNHAEETASLRAGLKCWRESCPIWGLSKKHQIAKLRCHHPRRFKGLDKE